MANRLVDQESKSTIYNGQTCLESVGMAARKHHLMRNEWGRDVEYCKRIVDEEYNIQTEFKVSSYEDELMGVKKQNEVDNLIRIKENAERRLEMIQYGIEPSEVL